MKKNYLKIKFSFLVLLFFSVNIFAQENQPLWSKTSKANVSGENQLQRRSEPNKADFYHLDINALKSVLLNAPQRESSTFNSSNVVISFPNSEGKMEAFKILESSVMEAELQAQYPEIRSYIGKSLTDPTAVMRFSVTPLGLHTMTLSSKGTQLIDPYTENSDYIVYSKNELPIPNTLFECGVIDEDSPFKGVDFDVTAARNANDGTLRTYRLAMGSSVNYTNFHGGTVNGALEAMGVTMTRVSGVYERDLSITFVLVANNNLLISTNGNVIFDNGGSFGAATGIINGIIGSGAYDIGHVVTTGSGGVAGLGVVCTTAKARGTTGLNAPVGDTFDIDFVAHEIGHQFGATHPFNGSAGSCAGGNRTASTAYEPGSGSTIMAYAGICAPQNVQNNSDDYFHQISLQQIWDFVSVGNGGACDTPTATGNTAPTANAGNSYSIPISTPYKLTASSTDVDGTASHTFTWEQFDLGPAGAPTDSDVNGPMVRSFQGTNDPVRFIPRFTDVIANGGVSTTWEKLASVDRDLNFQVTVRDNDASGGQTASDAMTVTTISAGGAFTIATPPAWGQNSTQTVNWNVGVSNVAPINSMNVNILFSSDGGVTFPTTLASNVANDGSQDITVPNIADTTNARIMVEAADNIFYNISDTFSISNTPDFSISSSNGSQSACNIDSVTYNLDYTTSNGFSENTAFTATGNPGGSNVVFTPGSLNSTNTFTMSVNNLLAAANGNYTITITATSPSITKNIDVSLVIADGVCASVANTTYATSTTGVVFNTISNLNTGKPSGYSDYTAMSTDVNRENIYDLTVNVNTDGNFLCTTIVWIDWNQNCSFNDAGEEYDLGDIANVTNGPTANSPLSITIPVGAALGNTIMRVTTKYKPDGLPTSCENGADAEVEDYTLNVLASLSVNENEFNNFLIYPNPNKGTFNVKMNALSENNTNITVYDIRGRKVYDNRFVSSSNFNEEITLSNVQSGLYLVKVSDGLREVTKKIVIE